MAESLENLVKFRTVLKGKLTRFQNFIQQLQNDLQGNPLSDVQANELSKRLKSVNTLLDDFEQIQEKIEIERVDEGIDDDVILQFETKFFQATAIAETLLSMRHLQVATNQNPISPANSVSSISTGLNSNVRLPEIKLQCFNGNPEGWIGFRDLFTSLIHENPDLRPVQKMHYLRSSLSGTALKMIEGLKLTDQNYDISWSSLNDRYNNSKSLIFYHVQQIFSLSSVGKDKANELRNFVDTVNKNLRSLNSLVSEEQQKDILLTYLLQSKLDISANKEFESHYEVDAIPTFDDLMKFLDKRASWLEVAEQRHEKRTHAEGKSSRSLTTYATRVCPFCGEGHAVYLCEKFANLDVSKRQEKARELKLCTNCLAKGHFSKQCRSKFRCTKCKSKHHSLLHVEGNTTQEVQESSTVSQVAAFSANTSAVLLPTVLATVYSSNGTPHNVKCLLDSGSMTSFVSKHLCDKLKLPIKPTNFTIKGIAMSESSVTHSSKVILHSQSSGYNLKANCLVINKITSKLPQFPIKSAVTVPDNITLADATFHVPSDIDILLGANYFWTIIGPKQQSLGEGKPVLQETKFGYVVTGPIPFSSPHALSMFCRTVEDNVDKTLSQFWEIENIPQSHQLSKEETMCEKHFVNTVNRNEDGRFVVSIPFKDNPIEVLGDSFDQACRRFYNLERKLSQNSQLKQLYCSFISEYQDLGHLKPVNNHESINNAYYLPHHGVLREDAITTKLRVVFDGSARTTTNISLNEIQMIGANVQESLFSILIRFRRYEYVFSADIEKMYRQVLVSPENTRFQRIVWRSNPDESLKTFELQTVTYGLASSSFLATRCLQELGNVYTEIHPNAAKLIKDSFYVDDLLAGANNLEEAQNLCISLNRILATGGFNLRKWLSNDPNVLAGIECSHTHPNLHNFNSTAKTLGLLWSNTTDDLLFFVPKNAGTPVITKRQILSEVSHIFDPLGLICPAVMKTKFLLQTIWLEKLAWDEVLPSSLSDEWKSIRSCLPDLNKIRFPRNATDKNVASISLHGFCDASIKGYGACVYMRSVTKEGKTVSNILCAKGKVAPLKSLSIPRLELCGALILVRLVEQVTCALDIDLANIFLWTDSTIVLSWLKVQPSRLHTFVSNRISEIQELSQNAYWRHVPSEFNPADLISRGVKPTDLVECQLWHHGPRWLTDSEDKWSSSKFDNTDLPEIKTDIVLTITSEPSRFPIDRFSSLNKAKRVVAFCLRFSANCRLPAQKRNLGLLQPTELNVAMIVLIKVSQEETFSKELECIKNKGVLKSSRILNMNPFIADDGILRVGGRIQNSCYAFEKKHPALISSNHHLAKLIISHEHNNLFHAGPQHVLFATREYCWITSARNLCRKIVHNCVICFKHAPRITQPIMGNLPRNRTELSSPFSHTSIDFAGPFIIRNHRGRGSKNSKCYFCIFVCFSTKAIHLELVSDLSAEHFLLAFRRFVARRGRPSNVYSDNGTNFVGANAQLKEFVKIMKNDKTVLKFNLDNAINWHFMPPYSPHMGGLHEAGVKSVKHHLKRVIGNNSLTFEEFSTLLTQIEGILNSRPISPMSSDPSDLDPLTPGHFLIGRSIMSCPDEDVSTTSSTRLSRFQYIQQLAQHIWNRWSKEYLGELQRRTKWNRNQSELKTDALVLIRQDNCPPLKWKLGRVVSVHPGRDGVVRVATVRTTGGNIKRSFANLCPLPID